MFREELSFFFFFGSEQNNNKNKTKQRSPIYHDHQHTSKNIAKIKSTKKVFCLDKTYSTNNTVRHRKSVKTLLYWNQLIVIFHIYSNREHEKKYFSELNPLLLYSTVKSSIEHVKKCWSLLKLCKKKDLFPYETKGQKVNLREREQGREESVQVTNWLSTQMPYSTFKYGIFRKHKQFIEAFDEFTVLVDKDKQFQHYNKSFN